MEEKEKLINKEYNRLKRILKQYDIDKNKISVAEGLIKESAFMKVTLEELKNNIMANGVVDEMNQGNYTILRESPAVKTYNTMVQRYANLNKQLFSVLPDDQPKPEEDGFQQFMSKR